MVVRLQPPYQAVHGTAPRRQTAAPETWRRRAARRQTGGGDPLQRRALGGEPHLPHDLHGVDAAGVPLPHLEHLRSIDGPPSAGCIRALSAAESKHGVACQWAGGAEPRDRLPPKIRPRGPRHSSWQARAAALPFTAASRSPWIREAPQYPPLNCT